MIADHLSIAFQQSAVPIISDLCIENQGGSDLADIEITLVSEASVSLFFDLLGSDMRHRVIAEKRLDAGKESDAGALPRQYARSQSVAWQSLRQGRDR